MCGRVSSPLPCECLGVARLNSGLHTAQREHPFGQLNVIANKTIILLMTYKYRTITHYLTFEKKMNEWVQKGNSS